MKKITLLSVIAIVTLTAHAQKLPNKQEVSLKAPTNLKIDGKANEWGDKLQAYNSATEVNYAIANDDKNLYLVVHAVDPLVIRKIIAGSLTFTINTGAAKDVAVTFPLFNRKTPPRINLGNKAAIIANAATADSFMLASNNEFARNAKQMKIIGIKAMQDTLSVYNEEGIVAAARFNKEAEYTYELAVPLKYLHASGMVKTLNYNIKFNGSPYAEGVYYERIEGGQRLTSPEKNTPDKPWPSLKDMEFISAATDVSGTYTLAP